MKQILLNKGAVAIVDDDEYERLNQFKWNLGSQGYAVRYVSCKGEKVKQISMHREILGTPNGMVSDHINGNRLDNRRENLRVCTRSQNAMNSSLHSDNTSGQKGVSYHKQLKRWKARIMLNKIEVFLGTFSNPEEAALAYNEAATKYFGEFAKLNTIKKGN